MNKQRFFLTQLLLCVCLLLSAVDLATYYSAAKGKKGSALKTALANIIYKSSAAVSYSDLMSAYQKTDVRSDGCLYDIYSNTTSYKPSAGWVSSSSVEGGGANREHLIPQSLFSKNPPMVSDLHHIYPCDAKMNSIRSNYCHGNVGTVTTYSNNNFSKFGSPSSSMSGCTESKVFEPNDEYKGDIARAYFYFVTCYETKITSWGTTWSNYGMFDGTTYPAFSTWAKTCLLAWSKLDQVSTKETTRNEAVYNYPSAGSNNRNPFVDFPGLEEYIWGSYTDVAFDPSNYTNPYTSGGGGTTTTTPTLTFNNSSVTMTVGTTVTNKATSNSSGTITYKSSNTSVATVTSNGVITGVAAGSATITATVAASGNYSSTSTTCAVTVSKGTQAVTFATTNPTVVVGSTVTDKATTTGDGTITYKSNNTSVATVSSTGVITGVKAGTATITATASATTKYNQATATTTVVVTEKTLTTPTLTFAKTNVSLEVGKTVDNPATTNSTGTVTYKSSNTEVATVSSTGVITGVAAGSAVITASVAAHGDYAAKTTSCNVTVTKSTTGGDDSTTGTSGTGTYTVTSTSAVATTGTVPSGSSATFAQSYTATAGQITANNTAILTLSGYDGYKITGITLNIHSNTSKGAGTLSVVAGSTTLASISSATNFNSWYDNTSYTTTFKDVTVSMTNTSYTVGADEKVVITITGTTNSLYISSYTITYESATTAKVGDVNLDGSVDVSDVTALVDIILGKWSGNHGEADFDGDGSYTVSDVTKLVDLILKK